MERTNYLVDYTADYRGERIMAVKYVTLIDGYSTFGDIPKILETTFGHKNIVILKAELKVN